MTTNDTTSGVSVPGHFKFTEIDSKTYETLQANFALLGHVLQHNRRADDGRHTYIIERWGQARYFTHLHDVTAFLTQIGGAK